ncbi:L-seryl-tRNA(Sec) selenium transferase [Alkalibacter mobilis]|uniref:L-seryl-tRNA(Sec) selenium transferase n=1 Tax=Alkalibacter mobilis TaxID=2787712 RepID=UPI00189F6C32|nr:L-seryl-tRNA(Sec) selenium transferase [Alkalibacter mobilis]MBF7096785.1 L-seryl-tRNA(Sec) selenium transferase [Alkalibacter mobilis]
MVAVDKKSVLRSIPPVNDLLGDPIIIDCIESLGRETVIIHLRKILQKTKDSIIANKEHRLNLKIQDKGDLKLQIISDLVESLKIQEMRSLKKVINATGIVLHTNLGRAPLPDRAINKVAEISSGYSNLEYDLEKGKRGSRYDHLEEDLCRLTGSESAVIVNNNAAAVFLCLNTFAQGKEVIVSRGEQVEIGGSFRIPEIIQQSGCFIKEVGTTNKTHPSDYENALSDNTSILLKVHTSNYKISGFVSSVDLKDILVPAECHDIIKMEDLGSGCLSELSLLGLSHEKTPKDCLDAGADIVTFSGDKLLGGSQAGIIIGKKNLIERIKKNPLARIVRCDKMTIAAMSAVLDIYLRTENFISEIPVLEMLHKDKNQLSEAARLLEDTLNKTMENLCTTEIIDVEEEAGGGSLPGAVLEGKAVGIHVVDKSLNSIAKSLRQCKRPIICRIVNNKLLLHVRTLKKEDFPIIAEELRKVLGD